jgi:hypothetical protein
MPTFQDLFDRCAFHAFENQMRLSSLVGEHQWLLNTEEATITFNEDLVFKLQFLGTESAITGTWLWADANDKVAFPKTTLELCRRVRAIARAYGLVDFLRDRFEFIEECGAPDGHTLAMVATCLGGASCYYRCAHDNGVVVVTLSDPRIDTQPDLDRQGFHEAFTNLMWQPGNMKKRIVSYCSDKGFIDKDWDGEELTFTLSTGEDIGLFFRATKDGGREIGFTEHLT